MKALGNTVYYTVLVTQNNSIGITPWNALNLKLKGRIFARTIVLLPYVILQVQLQGFSGSGYMIKILGF